MFYCDKQYKETKLSRLNYCKQVYKKQQEIVAREQYIEKLMFNDYVEAIKQNVSQYDCMTNVFTKAQLEIGKKYKKERANLEQLKECIEHQFWSDQKINITRIVQGGYETYYWSAEIVYNKQNFELQIPRMDGINTSNIMYANWGQFKLLKQINESVMECVIQSYEPQDISNYIKATVLSKNTTNSQTGGFYEP